MAEMNEVHKMGAGSARQPVLGAIGVNVAAQQFVKDAQDLTPRAFLKAHPETLRLYAVTDNSWLDGRPLSVCVAEALEGGATFVQLRDKHATTDERVEEAATLKALCGMTHAPFVINDDVEAARRADADGVHVGQSDAACSAARLLLGEDKIVGVSVQTVEQALAAEAQGADYLGVGALFGTSTKKDASEVSMDTLKAICEAVSIPVVGIGGLNAKTIPGMAETGVEGAAVVSAIFAAPDIRRAAEELREVIHGIVEE